MIHVAHVENYKPENVNEVDNAIARYMTSLPTKGFEVELWHFIPKISAGDRARSMTRNNFSWPSWT